MKNANEKNIRPEGFQNGMKPFNPDDDQLFYQEAFRTLALHMGHSRKLLNAMAVSGMLHTFEFQNTNPTAVMAANLFAQIYSETCVTKRDLIKANFERFTSGRLATILLEKDFFREWTWDESGIEFVKSMNDWQEAILVCYHVGMVTTNLGYMSELEIGQEREILKHLKFATTMRAHLASLINQGE